MNRTARACSCLLVFAATLHAQGPGFEVASIKPNNSDSGISGSRLQPDGSYVVTNASLRALIMSAHGLNAVTERYRLVGGPGWIDSERFDVHAKGPEKVTRAEVRQMLRSLLEARFRLVVRRETRDAPMYALGLARRDGRLGPGLTTSSLDCSSAGSQALTLGPGSGGSGAGSDTKRCGFASTYDGRGGMISGGKRPIGDLAEALHARLGGPVVDRTGLAGAYDFTLRWTPETLANLPPDPSVTSSPMNDGTSLFAALEEQLGLKLESQRGPLEYVVIERVETLIPD